MLATAQIIVALFGIVLVLLSLWGMISPDRLVRMVRSVMDKSWGMPFAVGVRIIMGVALLFAAPASKFPVLFSAFGWLALIAAAALPVLGRERLVPLFDWFQKSNLVIRLWLIFGVIFGVFMLYGISGAFG